MLQYYHLDYNNTFNRGKLLNIGFIESNKLYDWQCYIMHDVDHLIENDAMLYHCPDKNPVHMSVAITKYGYRFVDYVVKMGNAYTFRLVYSKYIGGVFALNTSQYTKINGFSNTYWGW